MTDVRSTFHPNGDGTFTISRTQDVEPILDNNKALQNIPQDKKSDFRHVASIPLVIIEKWISEEGRPVYSMDGPEFARMIRRKLADPDYKWLRTG